MITLSKVSKWYPNFQVLKHCSTEVAKGEVTDGYRFSTNSGGQAGKSAGSAQPNRSQDSGGAAHVVIVRMVTAIARTIPKINSSLCDLNSSLCG
jgi:hypothetical protein